MRGMDRSSSMRPLLKKKTKKGKKVKKDLASQNQGGSAADKLESKFTTLDTN